jgi:hypothetical protein
MSLDGGSLIAANGGGVLLLTTGGVRRIRADGSVAWLHAGACASDCAPDAIRQRADGRIFAMLSIAVSPEFGYGARAIRVVELDAAGNEVDAYQSEPQWESQDLGLDLHVDGADVDVAALAMQADSLRRVNLLKLRVDALLANGFDPAD